ncbi:MAG: 2Fe-2S iron-sulfur cluster binding domain-containing protein [Alphaproteobacteria bacterium]|nr:MAG: 2Fe-2S iron-sulfur cluster binding domain-containing protein [Alphaproteobacteria bacterium]
MHDFQSLEIAEVKRETPEAVSITFAIPEALRDAFRFTPGQHLPVRATIGGEEQRRTYSICSCPGEPRLRIAIKRVADGCFSNWANATLRAGSTLEVMPPAGRFVLAEGDGKARHVVAFAAGAGITPIISMIQHALANEPATSFTLVYGNRTLESILFREELEDLKDRYLGRFTLLHVLSRNEESSAPLLEGRITGGKVTALAAKLFKPAEVAHVFLCGPGSMIKEARDALLALGVPRAKIHHEFFAPVGGARRTQAAQEVAKAPSPQPSPQGERESASRSAQGTEAIAVLDGIRHRFIVPPGGHVVDAALAAGIRVPYSCKGGMCCTCRARLVEGQVEMTLNYSLEPWEIERGFILTCQAVPKSERLVVDYDQM